MFHPARTRGLAIQSAAAVLFAAGGLACLIQAFRLPMGSGFVLYSLFGFLLLFPASLLIYRIFELIRSSYTVGRDGLRLRWGARIEDIPIGDVDWIRPYASLSEPLPLPRLVWPGALRGMVRTREFGVVEYMADDMDTLLLIATPQRLYAISPSQPQAFINAFQNAVEEGSLEMLPARSDRPARSFRNIWNDRAARILVLSGLFFTVLVFIIVAIALGGRTSVSLGFDLEGLPFPPVPAQQALLIPFLAGMAYLFDLTLGILAYQRPLTRAIAYILWAGGLISALLLTLSAVFVLRAPQI